MSVKEAIPDWLAFPEGFKDGRAYAPSRMHKVPKPARDEYARGYNDGREHAVVNKEDKPMTEAQRLKKEYPRAPKFRVHITKEMIEHAKVRDSSHCMIAMAVRAAMPQMVSISADLQTVRMSDPDLGLRFTYLTPRVGQEALIDFDQGELPEPYSMLLDGAMVTKMTRKGPFKTPEPSKLIEPANVLNGSVPMRAGGRPPPGSRLGKRREFGLRAMRR
jgi:hypothetical protein